jgi:hypothetical protein
MPYDIRRDDRIRTCDPLFPKQVRYQAAPHPVTTTPPHYRQNSPHTRIPDTVTSEKLRNSFLSLLQVLLYHSSLAKPNYEQKR